MKVKKTYASLRLQGYLVNSLKWWQCHKKEEQHFTRVRKLPLRDVLQLLLKKSVKSLQLVLNEWTEGLDYQITASALSQARHKLSHTAFIDLNEKCIVDVMYRVGEFKTFKGHRLLAVDGTTLRLPRTKETIKKFGIVEFLNGKRNRASDQVEAKASILYDLLNNISISATLSPGRTNDLKASRTNLPVLKKGDLLVADRGYGSYDFFSEILKKEADFIVRLKDKTYTQYHRLLTGSNNKEEVIEVTRPRMAAASAPDKLKLRLIRVDLPSGEIEILATSLLDKKKYPHSDFGKIYHKRWGIETFFHTLKSRLAIDNFTGKSVESIYQDFYSCIFVSGLETIITLEANEELEEKNTLYEQKVNKVIAFHTIKHQIVEMIFNQDPKLMEKTKELFLLSPTLIRPGRIKEKSRATKLASKSKNSLYFQKFFRKHVF